MLEWIKISDLIDIIKYYLSKNFNKISGFFYVNLGFFIINGENKLKRKLSFIFIKNLDCKT